MTKPFETVTPDLLRDWQPPSGGSSKYGRGQILVIGGAACTPGAVLLAGLAALRVGGGRLSLAAAESVTGPLAVAVPEAGVYPLRQNSRGSVLPVGLDSIEHALEGADAVVVGPGLDDAELTAELLGEVLPRVSEDARVVLDAFALGALSNHPDLAKPVAGRLVLTPNDEEGTRLLGKDIEDTADATRRIAARFDAFVALGGWVADPDARSWHVAAGHPGLATSGSGDVLAGAVAGLLARGAETAQALCWGSYLHKASGDRLAARVGKLGFLARELLDELPLVMVELSP